MTGTSCDGMDISCIEVTLSDWQPLWSESVAYPASLRSQVLALQKPKQREPIQSWLALDRDLGNWYADALKKALAKHADESPQIIANHGQTLAHFPDDGTTLQLGDPSRIGAKTGLTVISNFRRGDMAAGGQGAPLVPLFHRLIAHQLGGEGGIAIHNLGGISNLTYVGPDGDLLAFDTGPGNIWIDAATELATKGKQKYDMGGKLASANEPDRAALSKLLKDPYFKKKPPKSTGRDDFPIATLIAASKKRDGSLVATATALTIESIATAYENFIIKQRLPLKQVLLSGGGAKNPALLAGLRERLPKVKFSSLEEVGFDPQLVESQAFAFFGFLSLLGSPIGGAWTGAKSFGPPGEILPGENWNDVLRIVGAMDTES
jgi:anhydro-N-acetylmuramic acid kinase